MDRFDKKQARLEKKKAAISKRYSSLWQGMVTKFSRPDGTDRAWLLYSANYLFRTNGVRWAIDPLTLRQRISTAPEVDVSALSALDYIVLTHRHADHLDLRLLERLLPFPARWIVPEFLLDMILPLNPPPGKLIIPQPLTPLHLGALILVPFDGLHWELDPGFPDGKRGVPAMGYLAEFSGKRWLIPGDIRRYDPGMLPPFGSVDGIFAHLWLGRGSALKDKMPLLEQFCKFILSLSPRSVILSHLQEFGRNADEFWDLPQASLVQKELKNLQPHIDCRTALMGDELVL